METKILTVSYPINSGQILLGLKKINYGKDLYNGFGGHMEPGETIEKTAVRELEEESGLAAVTIEKCGLALINQDHKSAIELHFFLVTSYTGKPQETDEMSPYWFGFNQIPYQQMWPTDKYILPFFIKQQKCLSYFHLSSDGKRILINKVLPVDELPTSIDPKIFRSLS